jgi:hypothetical protein
LYPGTISDDTKTLLQLDMMPFESGLGEPFENKTKAGTSGFRNLPMLWKMGKTH